MNNGQPTTFKEWWQTRPKIQKIILIGGLSFLLIGMIGGTIAFEYFSKQFGY